MTQSKVHEKCIINMTHFKGVLDQYQNAILQYERGDVSKTLSKKAMDRIRRKRKELRNILTSAYRETQKAWWRDFHHKRDQNDDYSI